MSKSERQERIVNELATKPQIFVSKLASKLSVSQATIRKDLAVLEESGLLKRIHGGAIAMALNTPREIDFLSRAQEQKEEKQAIANLALTLIEDHDSILLDASSTCYELAKLLRNATLVLTVITNGIQTASLLSENKFIRVYVVGGAVRNGNALGGLVGAGLFSKIHAHKAFMSARGIDLRNGLTDFNLEEVELKSFMVEQVSQVFALVDHTKIGNASVAGFCPVNRISMVITDSIAESTSTILHDFEHLGIPVRRPLTNYSSFGAPR